MTLVAADLSPLRRATARISGNRSPAALAVAAVLFAVILTLRLVITTPGVGVTLLYDVPVALVAITYGARAGLIAAAVAFGLYALGENVAAIHVGDVLVGPKLVAYLFRGVTFFLVGGLVGLFSDERRRTEAELDEARLELERRNVDLERSNADLAQYAHIVSHDLQQPLRVIDGFVQMLAHRYQGKLDEEADRFIAATLSGVDRMQQLIDALLSYSRVGNADAVRKRVDIAALVESVAASMQDELERAQGSIVANGLPTVEADPLLLEQLLRNLISNALKFCDADQARVEVEADRQNGTWRFSVSDNGPGIDPRHREQVFDIFNRQHGRSVEGTGIGLAICRRIVERHGGRIWVEAAPGGGSDFKFTLSPQSV